MQSPPLKSKEIETSDSEEQLELATLGRRRSQEPDNSNYEEDNVSEQDEDERALLDSALHPNFHTRQRPVEQTTRQFVFGILIEVRYPSKPLRY